jgi:hypothetical protein
VSPIAIGSSSAFLLHPSSFLLHPFEEATMNQMPVELETKATPLAERMDESIGEATSVLGAVLTELVRRTLRGGVTQIGNQLESYVAEKVDDQIADRLPGVERAAAEAADGVARSTALDVARREVASLEQQTRETALDLQGRIDRTERGARLLSEALKQEMLGSLADVTMTVQRNTGQMQRELATRISDSEQAAQQRAEDVRHTLTAQIVESERAGQHRAEEVRQVLTAQLMETELAAQHRAEEVRQVLTLQFEERTHQAEQIAEDIRQTLTVQLTESERTTREEVNVLEQNLTGRIGEVEKKAEEGTAQTATHLTARIEETEKRVREDTSAEINRNVQELLDSSRKATSLLKTRLVVLEGTSNELAQKLQAEQKNRQEQEQQLKRDFDRRLHDEREQWQGRVDELAGRLAELERPRGLRALWAWLTGKRR